MNGLKESNSDLNNEVSFEMTELGWKRFLF